MASSVSTEPDPMFTLRRALPFLIVTVLSALSPAIPHEVNTTVGWWAVSWALIAVTAGACYLASQRPSGHWLYTVAPLLLLPVIQALRAADGSSKSGFLSLLFLPVVWFALYGQRRDVWIALVGSALVALLPIVLVGAPRYPASSMRGSLLLLTVLVAVGVLISTLVESGRRTTGQLRVSESRFRAAFDDAPVGMALTGVVGPQAGCFIRVNRALCAIFGRTAAELTSKPVEAFTHPDDVATTRRLFESATNVKTVRRFEKRYLHSSGRTILAAISYSLVTDEQNEPLYLVSQIEDVSARRDLDQALLEALDNERAAADRMRELDQIRSKVLSGVAHDLRTPLTAATGFAELLADGSAGPLNPGQAKLLDTISRSLGRLTGMVEELITTSRRDQERTRSNAAPVDVDALVSGAIQTTSMVAAVRQQHLTAHLSLDGVKVRGDANRLDRALVNLLSNAVKFTPDGNEITVETSLSDDRVAISITDTGMGIAADEQERIFERYYRSVDVATAISGSGIGLAIVKEIITQHGGTVEVRSEPGSGSTFTVYLPVLKTDSQD